MARTRSVQVRRSLIDSASELFYERGVASTGVDAVAGAAGIGKPALYRHFGSKAGLLVAALAARHEARRASLGERLQDVPSGRRVVTLVEWIAEWIESEEFAGCAFVRAAAERRAVDEQALAQVRLHKHWLGEAIRAACDEDGINDAAVSRHLLLLIEGATSMGFVQGREAAADLRLAAGRVLSRCR